MKATVRFANTALCLSLAILLLGNSLVLTARSASVSKLSTARTKLPTTRTAKTKAKAKSLSRRWPQATSDITSVSPSVVTQGATVTLTVQGAATNWVNGQTTALFNNVTTDQNANTIEGAGIDDNGISVNGQDTQLPGSVTVIDATDATIQVTVSANAALGPWNLEMDTPPSGGGFITETETLTAALTITAANAPGTAAASVTTIAGVVGSGGFADGAGGSAQFNHPSLIAIGPDDSIYVADKGNNCIRIVRNISGQWTVSTYAGVQTAGYLDGPAASAKFSGPEGVTVDSNGVVYVADRGNNRIRKITTDGTVSTFAGSGAFGHADGQGTAATFFRPEGITIDASGNLYVTDGNGGGRIRMIDPSANVTTIGGNGIPGSSDSPSEFFIPTGAAFDDSTQTLYLSDSGNQRIRTIVGTTVGTFTGSSNGFADGPLTSALFAQTRGVALDGDGHLLVTDAFSNLIRQVDLNPAAQDFIPSVATLAGTGQVGSGDGAGSTATFNSPWGIAVSQSSAIYVADLSNNTIRQMLFAPVISSFTPTQGSSGTTVTISGHYFDGRLPSDDTVSFSKSGGGLTQATVSSATRTQLVVTVPSDAISGPITVQTQGGTTASSTNFVVPGGAPTITDFNPKSGDVGTNVVITGTNLQSTAGPTTVTFAGGAGTLAAFVSFTSATEVHATVPNGALTGPITLTTPSGSATTAAPFTVVPAQDYQITLSPSQATAIQGGTATYVVSVTSSSPTFTQLVSLSADSAPGGGTATFDPEQITAGATSTLTLTVGSGLATGNYSFNVDGSGLVSGAQRAHSVSASVNVAAAGQTTLSGRVLSSNDDTPIPGATVSLDGQSATTDGSGSFLLSGINVGNSRPLVVDGRTASVPNRTYPVISEPANVVAGQANQLPFDFYLPSIDTQYQVQIVLDQAGAVANDTPVTNPRLPGVVMTIPKGAHLRNLDGTPVTQVSITPVAIDRAPAPLPDNIGIPELFTSQPGGATTDIPIPVVYTNPTEADPGTKVPLYYFDHDALQWEQYGFGDVSTDGRAIVPETDPNTGKPYGLPNFSWHGPAAGPDGNPGDAGGTGPMGGVSGAGGAGATGGGATGGKGGAPCPSNRGPNPVDYSTGVKLEDAVDISFRGARGGLTLERIFSSDLAARKVFGRFGRGWRDNYDIVLTGSFAVGGAGRIRFAEQMTGRLLSYVRTDPDGALIFANTGIVSMQGDVLRKLTDGTFQYRYKQGGMLVFDQNGQLTSIVDRNGNTTSLTYDGSGSLTRISDAVGRSITLVNGFDSIDGVNLIQAATDPLGNVWTYSYSQNEIIGEQLTGVTDPLNHTTQYGYGLFALGVVVDNRGNQVKVIDYDSNSRVVSEQFADSGMETFNYTLAGGIVTSTVVTDPMGRQMAMRFRPGGGYVTSETDPAGQTTTIDRDLTTGQALSVTGPCGCTQAANTYDSNGNVLTSTDRLGRTEMYQYEPVFNNVTSYTDKLGNVTTFGYDSNGNLTSITRAANSLGLTTTFTYDSFGQMTSVSDPLGHQTQFQYDGSGNLTARLDPLNNRTTFQYDALGRLTSIADPLGRTTAMTYDALRITHATDPAGATTQFTYDENGNATQVTDGLGNTWSYAYDKKNNVQQTTDPLNQVTLLNYDLDDEVSLVASPSGRKTSYSYDSRGQLMSLTDPLQNEVRFAYDNQGNLVGLTDQRLNTTTYAYDELFRPISRTDPVGNTSRVAYDAMDNVTDAVDRLGRHTQTGYDDAYRPTTTAYTDATVTKIYDAASRLMEIDDTEGGNINWTYDEANRILSETTPAGVVSYEYNAANQRTSMTAADRPPVTYGYDSAGRLQTITQGAEVFTYGYDTLSRRTSLQRPNGVTTSYGYDAAYRLARLTHTNSLGVAIEDLQYGYDLDDEITSISSLNASTLLPQSASVAAADAANRIAQFGASSYTFDAEGQTTSKTDSTGTTHYQWDARGRLTRVTMPTNQTSTYSYDSFDRRLTQSSGVESISYLHDGLDVVLDSRSDGSALEYLDGPDIDEKLRQTSAMGSIYFLSDHLGSTLGLSDVNGNLVQRLQYEAYGKSYGDQLTRYTFTGREADSLAGLVFYRSRWYDPAVGRFVSEDPSGLDAGPNLYEYVRDAPTKMLDPLGLSPSGKLRRQPPPRVARRPCTPAELAECEKICGSRGVESCRVSQVFRVTRAKGGVAVWVWADGPLSCSCNEGEECDKKKRREPKPVPKGGPTLLEMRLLQESARYREWFWKDILIADYLIGVVGTGGALGVTGGAGALVLAPAP